MKRILMIGLLMAIAVAAVWGVRPTSSPDGDQLTGFTLEPPLALAQSTTFPMDEAGPMAYAKREEVEFSRIFDYVSGGGIENAFYDLEARDTDGQSYVWVAATPNTSKHNFWEYNILRVRLNLYMDTNGWVVAFLPASYTVAHLVDWRVYGYEEVPPKFNYSYMIREAVDEVADSTGNEWIFDEVFLFDPRHPNASKVYVAGERGRGSFSFLVPARAHAELIDVIVTTMADDDSVGVDDVFAGGELFVNDNKVADFKKTVQFIRLSLDPHVTYNIRSAGSKLTSFVLVITYGESGS